LISGSFKEKRGNLFFVPWFSSGITFLIIVFVTTLFSVLYLIFFEGFVFEDFVDSLLFLLVILVYIILFVGILLVRLPCFVDWYLCSCTIWWKTRKIMPITAIQTFQIFALWKWSRYGRYIWYDVQYIIDWKSYFLCSFWSIEEAYSFLDFPLFSHICVDDFTDYVYNYEDHKKPTPSWMMILVAVLWLAGFLALGLRLESMG
jgi:hypothetical protein